MVFVMQLKLSWLRDKFFKGHKKNLIGFFDQLLYYLYTLDYLSMFVLIYTRTIQEVGSSTPLFIILFIGPYIMVKVTHDSIGFTTRIDGKINTNLYTEILGNELLKILEYYDYQIENVYFQQDNDPKYTSKLAKKQ